MCNTEQRREQAAMPDEKDALARCAAGDTNAYGKIVNAYRNKAYYYALSILHNHEDALDVSQEAFVKAFSALSRFDRTRPFLPWFMRILRNMCINAYNKRKRRPEYHAAHQNDGSEDVVYLVPSGDPSPADVLARRETADWVRQAMKQLPDKQREVLFLFHFEYMTYETIAEILDIPVGTVMSRLFHARKKLAELLKADGVRV